jgi:hypothetical protein
VVFHVIRKLALEMRAHATLTVQFSILAYRNG